MKKQDLEKLIALMDKASEAIEAMRERLDHHTIYDESGFFDDEKVDWGAFDNVVNKAQQTIDAAYMYLVDKSKTNPADNS